MVDLISYYELPWGNMKRSETHPKLNSSLELKLKFDETVIMEIIFRMLEELELCG
jgi:hypothetical protein